MMMYLGVVGHLFIVGGQEVGHYGDGLELLSDEGQHLVFEDEMLIILEVFVVVLRTFWFVLAFQFLGHVVLLVIDAKLVLLFLLVVLGLVHAQGEQELHQHHTT